MRHPRTPALALMLGVALSLAVPAGARPSRDAPVREQAPGPAKSPVAAATGANLDDGRPVTGEGALSVERIALATRLADESRKAGYPMGLAAAAQLLSSEGAAGAVRRKSVEGGDPSAPEAGPPPETSSLYEPQALFNEAAALARAHSNEGLAAAIEEQAALSLSSRQSLRGAVQHYDRVGANATDVYTVAFRARERAVAMAVADGDYDIDLVVKDENGNTVASDRDSTHVGMCEWTPRWTGDFALRVVNTTAGPVDYTLITN